MPGRLVYKRSKIFGFNISCTLGKFKNFVVIWIFKVMLLSIETSSLVKFVISLILQEFNCLNQVAMVKNKCLYNASTFDTRKKKTNLAKHLLTGTRSGTYRA